LDNKIVSALLLGINTGVCILMTTTFISLFRQMKKNILTYIIMIITAVLMLCILYFNLNISSVIIIIIGAIIGIILNGFDKREGNKND
jgi:chromate transport protein ChrA